jgi:hypothetical protein
VFILVESHLPLWGVDNVIPNLAVVGDAVEPLELMHREDIGNPLREVPDLEPSITSSEICCH